MITQARWIGLNHTSCRRSVICIETQSTAFHNTNPKPSKSRHTLTRNRAQSSPSDCIAFSTVTYGIQLYTHQSSPLITPITRPTIIYHTHTTKGIIPPPGYRGFPRPRTTRQPPKPPFITQKPLSRTTAQPPTRVRYGTVRPYKNRETRNAKNAPNNPRKCMLFSLALPVLSLVSSSSNHPSAASRTPPYAHCRSVSAHRDA